MTDDQRSAETPDPHDGSDLDAVIPVDRPNVGTGDAVTDSVTDPVAELPAGVPSRGAFVLVFIAVVLAGFFGAVIGYGLTDLSVEGDAPVAVAIGTLIGAVGAAAGVGIVATLVLRAMSEWNTTKRRAR